MVILRASMKQQWKQRRATKLSKAELVQIIDAFPGTFGHIETAGKSNVDMMADIDWCLDKMDGIQDMNVQQTMFTEPQKNRGHESARNTIICIMAWLGLMLSFDIVYYTLPWEEWTEWTIGEWSNIDWSGAWNQWGSFETVVVETYPHELVMPHWKELAFNDTTIFDRYSLTDSQIDSFEEYKQCIGAWQWFPNIRESWVLKYGDEEQLECIEWKRIMKARNQIGVKQDDKHFDL